MDLGQIFTTNVVSDYMLSLVKDRKELSFLDPCFGSGAFIKSALKSKFSNITGIELDSDLFNSFKKNNSGLSLINTDFLAFTPNKKYETIVMNPPYVRQEKIDDLSSFGITKANLSNQIIFSSLPQSANLYMYFLIKAIDVLKQDGELVVIFPNSWIKARNGKELNNFLEANCCLLKQITISGEVFEKDPIVDVFILHLKKTQQKVKTVYENYIVIDGKLEKSAKEKTSISFDFPIAFKDYATTRRGITTFCNKMYVNPENLECKSKILSSPKNVLGFSTKNADLDSYFIPSSDLSTVEKKYVNKWKSFIMQNKKPKTLYRLIEKNNAQWYFQNPFDCKGIIFNYFVRSDFRFISNKSGYYIRDNFYVIKPLSTMSDDILFALLNNYFTFYQLEELGKTYGNGLLKIQRYDIENLKFPDIKTFSSDTIEKLKGLSLELIKNGKKEIIETITQVIASELEFNFEDIKKALFVKTTQRLKVGTK